MSMQGKFTGRVIKTEMVMGFTMVAITLDGPNDVRGINEVQALIDPQAENTKEIAEQALKWKAGELIQLEGDVVKIGKCECCGNPLPVVETFKCSKVFS